MKKREINAAQFKASCLQLMEEVSATRIELVIKKRGKPIAKLVPYDDDGSGELFGYLRGTVTIHGDIVAPIDAPWEASS